MGLHRFNAECDVLIKRNSQFLGSVDNVIPTDISREGFIFELALHGSGIDLIDAPARLDIRAGR